MPRELQACLNRNCTEPLTSVADIGVRPDAYLLKALPVTDLDHLDLSSSDELIKLRAADAWGAGENNAARLVFAVARRL
jgi:hypothetical protein